MGKKNPYYGKSMNINFPGFPHTMGFVAFSHAMGYWRESPCISHMMRFAKFFLCYRKLIPIFVYIKLTFMIVFCDTWNILILLQNGILSSLQLPTIVAGTYFLAYNDTNVTFCLKKYRILLSSDEYEASWNRMTNKIVAIATLNLPKLYKYPTKITFKH